METVSYHRGPGGRNCTTEACSCFRSLQPFTVTYQWLLGLGKGLPLQTCSERTRFAARSTQCSLVLVQSWEELAV